MTTIADTQDADLISRFPGQTVLHSLECNKIAAANSMIDFFAKKDPSCVARYFKSPYFNHNMRAPDGLDPVHGLAERAVEWDGVHTIVRRALAEGELVLLHSLYSNLLGIKGQRAAFDLFLFHEGKIIEHWDALQNAVEPDLSGLSHIEGSVDITDLDKGNSNRKIVLDFVETVLIGGKPELAGQFIDLENYTVHRPQRDPGQEREFGRFIPVEGAPKAVYLGYHITLTEGNFVFVQGEGRIGDAKVLEVYDLFRLKNGKIVEHWDILQALAPKAQWANPNGPFGYAKRS